MNRETKRERFRRLAQARGDRLLKDLELLGNLSNRHNYEYSEEDIQKLFGVIEAELRDCKARFRAPSQRRRIEL